MDHIRGLRFGPLNHAAHLCIDMQRMFDEDSPWASEAVRTALPAVHEICRSKASETIFTRFICPTDAQLIRGQWQHLYAKCPQMTKLDPRLFDIISVLRPFVLQGSLANRYVFSAFEGDNLLTTLESRGVTTLVFSGVETDVCVLASVLRAIDAGYRVIIAEEGVASSNSEGHAAALSAIFPRFDQQIELVSIDELLTHWGNSRGPQ
jgi:nicotinamidase-related amidase